MNKSFVTNLIAIGILIAGYGLSEPHLLSVGLFAFSGAITNWLAVHMLFEKVPFLYGSGIIPNQFEAFKEAIKALIMEQFFTEDNVSKFFQEESDSALSHLNLAPLLDSINYDEIFQKLIEAVMSSSLGGMVNMVGGPSVFDAVKDDFIKAMKKSLTHLSESEQFKLALSSQKNLFHPEKVVEKVEQIINQRLEELTPQLVKEIVSNLIRTHLGWLVIWGGVFGGAIGLAASFL